MAPVPARPLRPATAVALAAAALLAGCSAGPTADLPSAAWVEDDRAFVSEGLLFIHRDVGAGACTGVAAGWRQASERSVLDLDLGPGPRGLALALEWAPVNPSAARLNFTLWSGGAPAEPLASTAGGSPLFWGFGAEELDRLPRRVHLAASGDACVPPGAHASAIVDQAIAYRVTVG